MGAPLTIYNLYELTGGPHQYLLAKAIQREFSNSDQSAEDAARVAVERRFEMLVASQQRQQKYEQSTLVGTWEDACPDGDVFYSDNSGLSVEIWFSLDVKHGRHFVFGIAETEQQFWNSVQLLYDDGDLWGFDEFARPAEHKTVWLCKDRDITM